MADLNRKRGHFMIGRRKDLWHKNLCFKYSNGKIVAFDGERELAEFLYVHFQKRKLVIKENISSEFYFIAPNMVEKQFVETHFWRCIVYTCLMFFNRVKRKCLTFLKEER